MCANVSWADTTLLPLTDDTFVVWGQAGNLASNNYGAREDIVVHPYNAKYGLLRFDASSVAGQRINRATLRIFLNSLRENGWMHVYAVYSGWNEETVTFANHPPWHDGVRAGG